MILTHSPICEHISVLHERLDMTITWPFSANSIKFCMDRRETIIHRLSIRNPGYDAYYSILIDGRGLTLRMRPRVWGPWYPTEKLVHLEENFLVTCYLIIVFEKFLGLGSPLDI